LPTILKPARSGYNREVNLAKIIFRFQVFKKPTDNTLMVS
jgi:hypothetical protein